MQSLFQSELTKERDRVAISTQSPFSLSSLRLFSPAKINLYLKVVDKRKDGYHNLSTLIQIIDLFDEIEFSFSDRDELICSDPQLPTDSSNLIWKACALFREKTKIFQPLKIHLKKMIPSKAGLGGGSGNAATTLFALNTLFNHPFSLKNLIFLGGKIGSDVPAFFTWGTSYCLGRGERVIPVPVLSPQKCWIVKPPFGLDTPLVYQALRPPFEKKYPSFFYNDLEKPAFSIQPSLKALKKELLSQGSKVLMTGSGSSLICFGTKAPQVPSDHFSKKVSYLFRPLNRWYAP